MVKKKAAAQLHLADRFRREKSLLDIVKALANFDGNKFNKAALFLICFAAVMIFVAVLIKFDDLSAASQISSEVTRDIISMSFTYTLGITGFLIAGFAIIISINNGGLFKKLANKTMERHKNVTIRELSAFQYMFYNILGTLVIHLGFLMVIVATISAASFFRLLRTVGYPTFSPEAEVLINTTTSLVIMIIFSWCLLQLKSFVWNLYQALVLAVLLDNHAEKE